MWIVVVYYVAGEGHQEVLAIRKTEELARARMVELAATKGKAEEHGGDLFVDESQFTYWQYSVEFVEDIGS